MSAPKKVKIKSTNKANVQLPTLHPHAAGIDIGATQIQVAVPSDADPKPVRTFSTFTDDLHALRDWLKKSGVQTVAMESTSVYWIPLFQILEAAGLEVCLVNARHAKNLPGRKTDVSDCQWLQYLHSVGLLRASFRPLPPAPSRQSHPLRFQPCATFAKGPHPNEPPNPQRHQRPDRRHRSGHPRRRA